MNTRTNFYLLYLASIMLLISVWHGTAHAHRSLYQKGTRISFNREYTLEPDIETVIWVWSKEKDKAPLFRGQNCRLENITTAQIRVRKGVEYEVKVVRHPLKSLHSLAIGRKDESGMFVELALWIFKQPSTFDYSCGGLIKWHQQVLKDF